MAIVDSISDDRPFNYSRRFFLLLFSLLFLFKEISKHSTSVLLTIYFFFFFFNGEKDSKWDSVDLFKTTATQFFFWNWAELFQMLHLKWEQHSTVSGFNSWTLTTQIQNYLTHSLYFVSPQNHQNKQLI